MTPEAVWNVYILLLKLRFSFTCLISILSGEMQSHARQSQIITYLFCSTNIMMHFCYEISKLCAV